MHLRFLIMWLTLLTAGGCVGPDVRTDFNSSAEFSAFRTFAFTGLRDRDQGGVFNNSLSREQLEEMVRQQMTAKGLGKLAWKNIPIYWSAFW